MMVLSSFEAKSASLYSPHIGFKVKKEHKYYYILLQSQYFLNACIPCTNWWLKTLIVGKVNSKGGISGCR
ncbi:hypothetical protein Bca4012_025843 [Brassica carinata]